MEKSKTTAVLEGPEVHIPRSTIPQLFDLQFEEKNFGEKIALIHDEKKVSFLELRNQAEKLAAQLFYKFSNDGEMPTGLPKVFGLLTLPGDSRITAILGLLKLGCAYLPLDLTIPAERMTAMLQDAGVKYVIYDTDQTETALQKIVNISPEISPMNINDLLQKKCLARSKTSMKAAIEDDNPLVCVLHTSGSTGVPKGVPLYTRNILNRLTWQWNEVPFDEEDIGCHKTSLLFVDSVNEILSCLLKGVPIVILGKSETTQPEPFVRSIHHFKISRIVLVPSHLNMLIEHLQATRDLEAVSSLRTVISSGEELSLKLANQFFSVFPSTSVLYNFYGSTETTGDITYQKWDSSKDFDSYSLNGVMTLGHPIYNTCIMILDDHGNLCKEPEIGYIYAGGQNVVSSYLDSTGIDATIFVHNSINGKARNDVLYKMGDLGVIKEGKLYHQGRCDSQVKVRGHRVDLQEIKQVVEAVPGVESCMVLPYKDPHGYIVPVAFYIGKQNSKDIGLRIKLECEKQLPSYAVPRYMFLRTFPLQMQTGKVDRQRLLQLYKGKIIDNTIDIKKTVTNEQKILKVLARNLSLPADEISLDLNFFENGGNSISAVLTVSDLQSEGYGMTMTEFVSCKTIKDLLVNDVTRKEDASFSIQSRYQAVMLSSIDNKEQAIDVIAHSFSQKNILYVLAGVTENAYKELILSFWREVLDDDLSVVVIDKNTMDVVAGELNIDLRKKVQFGFLKPEVEKLFATVVDSAREMLLSQGGRWTYAMPVAVDVTLQDDIALMILEMMEKLVLDVVQRRGFNGILSINNSPVTIVSNHLNHIFYFHHKLVVPPQIHNIKEIFNNFLSYIRMYLN